MVTAQTAAQHVMSHEVTDRARQRLEKLFFHDETVELVLVGDENVLPFKPNAARGGLKAGVYAVRQGPVLWDNIQRILAGRPLRRYTPQRQFLRLINTGDGRAIGEWRGLSFEGRWCWRLKDYIDSRFMAQYQDYAAAR